MAVEVFFFLACFLGFGASVVDPAAAGGSAAIGAADFGMSADIARAARPKVNNAEVIRVPDLFMRSPSGGMYIRSEEYASIRRFHPR